VISRLEHLDAAPDRAGEQSDALRTWLGVLGRLLRLPSDHAAGVIDELECHLRERVRDLMVGGKGEAEALSIAFREVGDAAELAHRFHLVHRGTTRRRIMHLSIVGLSIGAAALGVVAVTSQPDSAGRVGSATFSRGESAPNEPPAWLSERAFEFGGEHSLLQIERAVDATQRVDFVIHWNDLVDQGFERTTTFMLAEGALSLNAMLDSITLDLTSMGFQSEWRWGANTVEIGSAEGFEFRSRELAAYDVASILWDLQSTFNYEGEQARTSLRELITSLVEPELWEDNGGCLAQMKILGGQMFVNAPSRTQERVNWILQRMAPPNDEVNAHDPGNLPGGGQAR
jgi:hypothetical protein